MGSMIDRKAYRSIRQSVGQGLFLLNDNSLLPKDIDHINVGLMLAERMREIDAPERQDMLSTCLATILSNSKCDMALDHIDILFDPQWNIDVFQLLLKVGRNKRLYIVWPGRIDLTGLTYAEPKYADYKIFNYADYIDTYAVMK